ncbi:unnamed protein product [Rhizoctonia solani]|uniref:Transmembrane protein n=1 Tax=Rhizoctonia solani TaxID=456999 RepID=A0A8H3DUB6_9AGAM|nr:unnamed protein product [Rhizoctonia solani]
MSLPPWDQLTFTFGWEPWVHTMRQCSTLNVEFSTDIAPGFVANPAPAPPYTVVIYAGGYRPLIMAVGNIGTNGTFEWVVNLPLGPQYILAMRDSAGYNGGSSLLWTMSTGSGSCALNPSPLIPSSLSFTRTGSAQCGQINYVMNNGTSPYQIEIIPEIHQRRTIYFATNKFGFIMDLPTGLNVYIAITDADGNSGVDQLMTVGTSSDNSCLKAAGTVSVGRISTMYTGSGISMPSATPTSFLASLTSDRGTASTGGPQRDNDPAGISKNAPIVAGVVAGIVAIAFMIFMIICIQHRRKRRLAAQSPPSAGMVQQQVNLSHNPYSPHNPNNPHNPHNPHSPYHPHNPQTYFTHPSTQYPSTSIPQIQTPGPSLYAPSPLPYAPNQFMPMVPNDACTHQFADTTTHVPRSQSYQTGQTPLFNGDQPPSQYPTSRYSQGTFPSSGNALSVSRMSSETGTSDEKKRVSPSLPPGALAPLSNLGQPEQPWMPQTPGTPPDGTARALLGSPRSEALTMLPPYGPAEGKPHSPAPTR